MEEIVEIYQEIGKYKYEDETIIEFYSRYKVGLDTSFDGCFRLLYQNNVYEIITHEDIKKFLSRLFREKKLLRIIGD